MLSWIPDNARASGEQTLCEVETDEACRSCHQDGAPSRIRSGHPRPPQFNLLSPDTDINCRSCCDASGR